MCPFLKPGAESGLRGGITFKEGDVPPSDTCRWVWCLLCHLPILYQIIFKDVFRNFAASCLEFPPATPLPWEETRLSAKTSVPHGLGLGEHGTLRGAWAGEARLLPGVFPNADRAGSSRTVIAAWGLRPLFSLQGAVCLPTFLCPPNLGGRGHRAPTQRLAPGSLLLPGARPVQAGLCPPCPCHVTSTATAGSHGTRSLAVCCL